MPVSPAGTPPPAFQAEIHAEDQDPITIVAGGAWSYDAESLGTVTVNGVVTMTVGDREIEMYADEARHLAVALFNAAATADGVRFDIIPSGDIPPSGPYC